MNKEIPNILIINEEDHTITGTSPDRSYSKNKANKF